MDDSIKTTAEAAESEAMPRVHEVHTDPDAKCADAEPLRKSVEK